MRVLRCVALVNVLLVMVSCSGAAPEGGAADRKPTTPIPPVALTELPALDALGGYTCRRVSDQIDRIPGYFHEDLTSANVEHVADPDSAILHSSASECSWAVYRYSAEHFANEVPYVAPYSIEIGGLNTEEFWLALADYGIGTWRVHPEPLTAELGEGEITVAIGLQPNATDVEGFFSFAIIAYGGAAPQIGYIDLAFPDAPAVGQPVDYHQYIAARDGTLLATNVYLPYEETDPLIADPPYPVLLMRTPYNKSAIPGWIAPTLTAGNVALMTQYFRGRLGDSGAWPDSGGTVSVFRDHAGPDYLDALDTVNWLEDRHWYNGELIMSGLSAQGVWIYQAATLLGGRVTATYTQAAAGNVGDWAVRTNGCLRRSNIEGWVTAHDYPSQIIDEMEANCSNELYWQQADFDQWAHQCRNPGYHETGWWDVNVSATIESWRQLQYHGGEGAAGQQWLVIGPWSHDTLRSATVGEFVFPTDEGAKHDPRVLPDGWDGTEWILNEVGRWPTPFSAPDNHVLVYFVGGPDRSGSPVEPEDAWYELPTWPPTPDGESVRYLRGVGNLLGSLPSVDGSDPLTTDPANPFPTVGGANLPYPAVIDAGPYDQSAVLDGPGVLHYECEASASLESYAGEVRAVLYVSTDAADTDIMVKLMLNDGSSHAAYVLCDTAVRLSWYLAQHGLGPVTPGTVYELDIKLGDVAFTLHWEELQLAIQGSNYPRFDINPGNGDDFYNGSNGAIQHTWVYYGEDNPSRVIIPRYDPTS